MKNENNIELISPIGETCNKVDLKKAMVLFAMKNYRHLHHMWEICTN